MRIAALAGFALLAACGDDTSAAFDSGPDAREASAYYDTSVRETGPCNALVVASSPTTDHLVADAAAMPVPDGGAIAPGLYFLTDTSVFLLPDASVPDLITRQEVHDFDDSGIWQFASLADSGAVTRYTLAVYAEGSTLHRGVLCPDNSIAREGQFTASSGELLLFSYTVGVVTVFTLTKQ